MIPATFSTREKEEKPRPQSFARKGIGNDMKEK
jgi:hypothetical protein